MNELQALSQKIFPLIILNDTVFENATSKMKESGFKAFFLSAFMFGAFERIDLIGTNIFEEIFYSTNALPLER